MKNTEHKDNLFTHRFQHSHDFKIRFFWLVGIPYCSRKREDSPYVFLANYVTPSLKKENYFNYEVTMSCQVPYFNDIAFFN
ncbi:hypothetical protein Avbf_02195, partial [Armadillidium vulgare]